VIKDNYCWRAGRWPQPWGFEQQHVQLFGGQPHGHWNASFESDII